MSRLTERARALAVAGGVAGGAALAGPAAANVIVNVPWAGTTPVATAFDILITPANVANVVRFVGITGSAGFLAGEGGTGNVFATVGGIERQLLSLTPQSGSSLPLSAAVAQIMAGTLTQIRLQVIPGEDTQNSTPDMFTGLQLAAGPNPTIFQFEVADGNAIPEPSAVLTFLFGLAGLEMARRWRRMAVRALPVA